MVIVKDNFIRGADISWLSEMEAANKKFYDNAGVQKDCMLILKEKGINAIRLRAWLSPENGWNNTKDLVEKAIRAKAMGFKIMIDFHYSDTWADPANQSKPKAWSEFDIGGLETELFNYTKKVMDTLKLNGIIPHWVQIGNETNDGMLWPEGKISSNGNDFTNFAALVTKGYEAVKAVSDTTAVIVHISNGHDNGLFRWMFDGLKNKGAKFDIIGMSLYPSYVSGGATSWNDVNMQCLLNMNDMIARYGKPVMLVEVGMPQDDAAASKAFLLDIIAKTKTALAGKGLGVMYWEPECYDWKGYNLGAFDNSGKPTIAMDAFLNQ